MSTTKYLGESTLNSTPSAPLKLKLKEGVVAKENLTEEFQAEINAISESSGVIAPLDHVEQGSNKLVTSNGIYNAIHESSKVEVDEENSRLLAYGENKNYFVSLTEFITPAPPSISTISYNVIIDNNIKNVSISVTNNQSGSTMYYGITDNELDDAETWTEISGNTISYNTGFANNGTARAFTKYFHLKSSIYGNESKVVKRALTFTPKVAPPTITVPNNKYATSATITITPSVTVGSETGNSYRINGGEDIPFTTTVTPPVSATVKTPYAAGYCEAFAEIDGYTPSDIAKNTAFTLASPMLYIGWSSNDTISLSDLTTFKSFTKDKLPTGKNNAVTTTEAPGDAYCWVCQPTTLTPSSIYQTSNDSAEASFEDAGTVTDGASIWYCYKSTQKWVTQTWGLYIKAL